MDALFFFFFKETLWVAVLTTVNIKVLKFHSRKKSREKNPGVTKQLKP